MSIVLSQNHLIIPFVYFRNELYIGLVRDSNETTRRVIRGIEDFKELGEEGEFTECLGKPIEKSLQTIGFAVSAEKLIDVADCEFDPAVYEFADANWPSKKTLRDKIRFLRWKTAIRSTDDAITRAAIAQFIAQIL